MPVVKSISLFFQEGSSDKVYNARIVEDAGTYSVEVEWGRRGTPLNSGNKALKVALPVAQKTFDKLVKEKTGKGYEEVTSAVAPAAVAPPVGAGSGSKTGVAARPKLSQAAQLLNAIEQSELDALFKDPGVIAQQKYDGVRLLVHMKSPPVATNRSGEIADLDPVVAKALACLPPETVIDGELLSTPKGPSYWVFDLLQHGSTDLRTQGYLQRYAQLQALAKGFAGLINLVATSQTEAEKRSLFSTLEKARAEGVVFKKANSPYSPGRPASGGNQLKFKFVKSADVIITSNAGNAYQMVLWDGASERQVGKVFAGTTNESRKIIDAKLSAGERPVAEVRYLYATDDLNLFQPVFAQLREDKDSSQCTMSQLIQTNKAVTTPVPPAPAAPVAASATPAKAAKPAKASKPKAAPKAK
jgi:bifunctional non-homologous end joining protein LigD